ncbi:MAG TPA: Ig-like domain-containing protein [Polyangia bacterium]|jgi:hypothetical protein|nr:Ig-like domain-containing protein [Polyangia bacterium]
MKPSYPWLAPVALLILTGLACEPDHNVKPGAPVLVSITIMDTNGGATEITGDTALCTAAVGAGGACAPGMDSPCRLGMSTWCHCAAGMMDMSKGTWACDPLPPMSSIVATFDRLLDTKPFEFNADAGATGPTGIVSLTATPAVALESTVDYSPNGDKLGLIFPLFFGVKGPRLLITPSPTLPAGSTITVSLDKTRVRAKDGKTGFTGTNLLADGIVSFMTAPLAANITVPVFDPDAGMPAGDGGVDAVVDGGAETGLDGGASDVPADMAVAEVTPDAPVVETGAPDGGVVDGAVAEAGASEAGADAGMAPPEPVMPGDQPVTVTFNNVTDPMKIPAHITVTVNGAPFPGIMIAPPADKQPGYIITPKTKWPANATITITVDADAADVLGVKLGSPASATFVTGS